MSLPRSLIRAKRVFGAGGGVAGSISAITITTPSGEDLTAAGYLDWISISSASSDRKNGANLILGSPTLTNASHPGTGVSTVTNSWTDGTPTASGSNSECGRWDMTSTLSDTNVDWTGPAGTGSKKFGVIAGGYFDANDSTMNIRFSLSDASAADRVQLLDRSQGSSNPPTFKYYEVTYNAATAGQTLRVRLESLASGVVGTGGQMFVALVRYGT
jgi:hypothetical protein